MKKFEEMYMAALAVLFDGIDEQAPIRPIDYEELDLDSVYERAEAPHMLGPKELTIEWLVDFVQENPDFLNYVARSATVGAELAYAANNYLHHRLRHIAEAYAEVSNAPYLEDEIGTPDAEGPGEEPIPTRR